LTANQHDLWIARREPRPACEARLFCIPGIGLGPAAYLPLADHLPAGIEFCVFRLPGREQRVREPAITRLDLLTAALADTMAAWLDRPYAVIADCAGSVVMLHLARLLRRRSCPLPNSLYGGGYPAPHIPWTDEPMQAWPLGRLADHLVIHGSLPAEVRDDSELLELMEPAMRADLAVVEDHVYKAEEPLPVPITMFCGSDEHLLPLADLLAWHEHTTESFTLQRVAAPSFDFRLCFDHIAAVVARGLACPAHERRTLPEPAKRLEEGYA
jgi:medium-chain acyl-[acyl-carrier-protein] hydrolase